MWGPEAVSSCKPVSWAVTPIGAAQFVLTFFPASVGQERLTGLRLGVSLPPGRVTCAESHGVWARLVLGLKKLLGTYF